MKAPARFLSILYLSLLLLSSLNPVFAADVNVTATVPSQATDFHSSLSSSPVGSPASQDTTLTYTLEYGSNLDNSSPLIVTASWSKGSLHNTQIDILEYVIGSATDAYNNTPPVIDPINRTITWNISSFPADTTDETLTFQLRTRNAHQNPDYISFTVTANVTDGTSAGATSHLDQSYRFVPPPPTTPGPTLTPTSAPQRTYPALAFSHIDIKSLSQNSATIYTAVTKPSQISFSYGTSPTKITTKLHSLQNAITQHFSLDDLTPQTPYYFRLEARAGAESITSDIFTFTTARESTLPTLLPEKLQVTSNNLSLTFPQREKNMPIILPPDVAFTVQFALDADQTITDGSLEVANDQVLGRTSFITNPLASTEGTPLLQTAPGILTGQLKTATPGMYTVNAVVSDANGNITQLSLFPLRVTNGFRVVDEHGVGIESARVFLKIQNPLTKLYTDLSPRNFPVDNPSESDPEGYLSLVLPKGSYEALVTASNYEKKTVFFTIGTEKGDDYPTVALKVSPFNLFSQLSYFSLAFLDHLNALLSNLSFALTSSRFFVLINVITTSLFILILLTLLAHRHHLPFPSMLSHLFHTRMRLKPHHILKGRVINTETDTPIYHASVFLFNSSNHKLLSQTFTHHDGSYSFSVKENLHYKVRIEKKGFHTTPQLSYDNTTENNTALLIGLIPESKLLVAEGMLTVLLRSLVEYSFETVLFLSFILELLFMLSFGIEKTLPYFLISLLSLFIYSLSNKRLT